MEHITLHTLHFSLETLHFIFRTPNFTLYSPHSALHTLQSTSTLYSPRFTLYNPNSILYPIVSARSTRGCMHFPPFRVHLLLFFLCPAVCLSWAVVDKTGEHTRTSKNLFLQKRILDLAPPLPETRIKVGTRSKCHGIRVMWVLVNLVSHNRAVCVDFLSFSLHVLGSWGTCAWDRILQAPITLIMLNQCVRHLEDYELA